jgi:hypothetical protein
MKKVVKLNENTIRKMVSETIQRLLELNLDDVEYSSDPDDMRWADTSQDILKKYETEPKFDDTLGQNDYKIDRSSPYFLNEKGKPVSADNIENFHNDFAVVTLKGKQNYVKLDGHLLLNNWYDSCDDFEGGFGVVREGKKSNYVNSNGELLLPEWVDMAGFFMGDRAIVKNNGERYQIDREGKRIEGNEEPFFNF